MQKTKIAIFGATSATGIELIHLMSTDLSIEIVAFVRNPEKLQHKLPKKPANLKIQPFHIGDDLQFQTVLMECDYWISLIGISNLIKARKPNALYEKTAHMLIRLGEQLQPKKVIVITSGGVVTGEGEPWILKSVLKPFFLNPMYEDMKIMEQLISKSNLNYIIVRPPYLTKGKLTGTYRTIENDWFKDDKVLSRKDLAHFIHTLVLNSGQTKNRITLGISY